jgi:hypothetical protein
MRKYILHLQETKEPHERRRLAVQIATVITAVLFLFWISSVGMRLANSSAQIAQTMHDTQNAAAALVPVQANSNATTLNSSDGN